MTHSGDGGKTSHPRSGCVSKASADICALGEIDELNAFVGQLQAALPKSCEGMKPVLLQIQQTLFKIGCVAAGTGSEADAAAIEAARADLERCIQAYREEVGAMRHFIVPGGMPPPARRMSRAPCAGGPSAPSWRFASGVNRLALRGWPDRSNT